MNAFARLRTAFTALAIVAVSALAGCASVYRVDNQVESFAQWADSAVPSGATAAIPAPPQRYRFERLPSRTSGSAAQSADALEPLVQTALKPLGWTLAGDAEAAPWRIEVTAKGVRLPRAPWEDPWEEGRFGWASQVHIGVGLGYGGVLWSPWLVRPELPYYQREVTLVIRDAATGRVVYETRAAHDGRWNSTPELWSAMVSAALEGFPAPPKGVRQVNLDVPR